MGKPIFKNLTRMAFSPFRERGVYQTLRSLRAVLYARRQERAEGFDRRYGTDTDRRITCADLRAEGPDVPPLWRYWPTLQRPFRRLLGAADVRAEEFVFVDLGSGKGRVLLLASDLPFLRIVGVELSPALHAVAMRNLRAYRSPRQRCTRFELVLTDAADYQPPVENLLVYLFQPFPRETLAAVLANLERSLAQHPRRVLIAYLNPLFHDLIIDTGRFVVRAQGAAASAGEFAWAVYENRR